MNFKQKISEYLIEKGISIGKIEQEGENESLVFHLSESDSKKIEDNQQEIEKELDVVIAVSEMFGMNVVIIESNNL